MRIVCSLLLLSGFMLNPGCLSQTPADAAVEMASPAITDPSTARRPGAPALSVRPSAFAPRAVLRVRHLAAGHGDSALIETPAGHRVLIDAGRADVAVWGDNLAKRRLSPWLAKRDIRKLDAVILSHPHFDHYGDLETLRQAARFDRVWVNRDGHFWLPGWLGPLLPGVRWEVLKRGDRLRFGRLRLEVLHPPAGGTPPGRVTTFVGQNNRSLVIRATFGRIRFLFMGDLHYGGELGLLASGQSLRADVIKLGHHGVMSTSRALLRAVRPQFAVASCGDKWRNRVDHLSVALRRRLARRRITLLRTDRMGDIVFETDGQHLDVRTDSRHLHRPVPPYRRRIGRSIQRAAPRRRGYPR